MTTTPPIRIVRLIARLNVGGPAIHVSLLTERLRERNYQTTLVCGTVSAHEGDMTYFARERGIDPVIIPELGRELHPLRDIVTLWKVYRLLRQLKPDVVHTHTAKAGFIGRVAAWLAGVPVIVHTFHGHVFESYFSRLTTNVFILLERIASSMSDTIITLTESLRRDLSEKYRVARKGRITVLPLGLDLAAFTSMPRRSGAFRQAHSIAPDAPLLGIVGRIVPIKNHALFIEAVALVRQRYPALRVVIIGDGELRAEVEAQVAARGLRDCVLFAGWLRDLAPVYSDLDVLVMSSLNEGTPVSVIEALASACPIVSTNVGGTSDLLEQGALGTLVPSGDAQALADAICATLAQPPDMEGARQMMVERYGIDRLVRDLDSLYRGLLKKKGRIAVTQEMPQARL
ncbi:MAG: glycosyltransferase family 4 protein [Chloroflexota bacterium]|nr:glycosyltransferase family 4 protein [Chloroflexota bacterium]